MNDILKSIFESPDTVAMVVFSSSALVGQGFHLLKKWVDGDADWVSTNLRRTVGAVMGNVGGIVVFVQTGVLGPMLSLPNGWWAIAMFGFTNGFSADSALNKGNAK